MDDPDKMPYAKARPRSIPLFIMPALCLWPVSLCFAELKISGIDSDLAAAVVEQSPLNGAACDAPVWWLDKQLDKTQVIAAQLLETQGFYQANFEHEQSSAGECWQAQLNITPGTQAIYGSVLLEGIDTLQFNADQLASFVPQTGTGFTHAGYEDIKSNVISQAHAMGYLDAQWQTNKVIVQIPRGDVEATSTEQTTADVELQLAPGPRYRFGSIDHQIDDIDPGFLAKFYDMRPGDPFTRQALDEAYQNLMSTGYLGALAITPKYDQASDQAVPVLIEGAPARKRSYEIGAGYATDSGPRTRGEVRWRRINDRGDRARLTAMLAEKESELSGEYRRADEDDPRNRWLSLGASYEFDEPDTYKREKTAITATQSLRREDKWLRTHVVQYSSEVWRIADTDGDTQLLSIGQGWQRSQGEGRGRLASGRSLNLSWRAAVKATGSDIDVLQMQAAYKTIHTLSPKWRLLGRAHLGINVVDDLDLLPPDLRFFAGGDNSVRGYDLDTLGEIRQVDGESVVIGGKRIVDGSIELDRAIRKDWSAALFVDAGSAFNNAPDLAIGVGVGARWYSPLGPIRIDLAHGFDGLNPGWRLHISFGAEL